MTTRRVLSAALSSALVAASLTAVLGGPQVAAAPGDGVLTVEVNRDFSGDGIYDPLYDPPQPGVAVTVTDGVTTVGPLLTDLDGRVDVDLELFSGSAFRVDVAITDPALDHLEPAPAAAGGAPDAFRSFTTFVGPGTQTIHVGVWNPATYVERNPALAIVQQIDRYGADSVRSIAVTTWDNRGPAGTSTADNHNGFTTVATQAETGTVFGTTWDHRTNFIYSAAYAKAHTNYGPGGNGAIYRTDASIPSPPGSTIVWAQVPDAGTSAHQTELGDGYDDPFFLANGRESLGGLALSEDGSTLYAVNLNTRSVYAFDTADAAPAPVRSVVPIQDPGCLPTGEWRPFAIRVRDGELYVGGVCDASYSLDRSDLEVHVVRLDGATFVSEFSHTLDFPRGGQGYSDPVGNLTGPDVSTHWNPWRNTWDADIAEYATRGPLYPTPMLTDIEFENDGSIILGFRDRWSDAVVRNGYGPDPDNRTATTGFIVGGDINKVCRTPAGVYEWEGTGSCPNNNTPATSGGEPAGRVEFFPGDYFDASIRYPDSTVRHFENSMGGLALSPREPDVANTTMDPSGLFNTGGIGFYDRQDGTGPGSDPLGRGLLVAGNTVYNFAKANGLGDLELLAAAAPVQIGNLVWFDADQDGEQDPDEPPIAGATVRLLAADGVTVLAETTTDANGEYYFGGEGGYPLEPGATYVIEFDVTSVDPATLPGSPTLEELTYTVAGAPAAGETYDSNPLPVPGNPQAARTTVVAPDEGGVDHTIDAGIIARPVPPAVSVGDFVWVDSDLDGIQDDGEPGIEGVTLVLTGPDGGPVTDILGAPVGPVVTDENGFYEFVNLPALPAGQSYTVSIDRDASADVLAPYVPTIANAGDDPAVDSSTWSATSGDLTEDGDRDPTLDFGFVPARVSVGDFVWVDVDRDGIQDDGEPGIEGVTLVLTGPDGGPVTDVFGNPVGPVVTDGNGFYEFVNLPVLAPGESYTVTIDQDASADALAPYIPTVANAGDDPAVDSSTWTATSGELTEDGDRDPTLDFGFVVPAVSVGDYVWHDVDRDGIQDDGEPGIPGVTLTLTGPDGEPVTDVFGNPVGPVVTDDDGFYEFVNLPALAPGESYTVTVTPPAGFIPTTPGVGDPAGDSSTGSATSGDLTEDGDRDPTLDFGFVVPAVSVGDYVWVDTDRDGRQDPGEPGIPGVTLTLTGPDGEPVTDVFGNPVGPAVTDGNGFYEFVHLPALAPGESYTVTVTPPAGYVPTTPGVGDSAGDSSTGSATSGDLVNDGDRDDTLDFGFVPVPEDPPGEEPPGEDPPGEDPPGETPQTSGRLPATGAVGTQVVQIALLLLVAGTGIVLGVRRRRTET